MNPRARCEVGRVAGGTEATVQRVRGRDRAGRGRRLKGLGMAGTKNYRVILGRKDGAGREQHS